MKGERLINGAHYLLAGRFSDHEKAVEQAQARRADGYSVRLLKLGPCDWMLYEFPAVSPVAKAASNYRRTERNQPSRRQIHIYQTPEGDWAFSMPGLIADGYISREAAMQAAEKRLARPRPV